MRKGEFSYKIVIIHIYSPSPDTTRVGILAPHFGRESIQIYESEVECLVD